MDAIEPSKKGELMSEKDISLNSHWTSFLGVSVIVEQEARPTGLKVV